MHQRPLRVLGEVRLAEALKLPTHGKGIKDRGRRQRSGTEAVKRSLPTIQSDRQRFLAARRAHKLDVPCDRNSSLAAPLPTCPAQPAFARDPARGVVGLRCKPGRVGRHPSLHRSATRPGRSPVSGDGGEDAQLHGCVSPRWQTEGAGRLTASVPFSCAVFFMPAIRKYGKRTDERPVGHGHGEVAKPPGSEKLPIKLAKALRRGYTPQPRLFSYPRPSNCGRA